MEVFKVLASVGLYLSKFLVFSFRPNPIKFVESERAGVSLCSLLLLSTSQLSNLRSLVILGLEKFVPTNTENQP